MSLSQALQERKRQAAPVPSLHQVSPLVMVTKLLLKKASLGPLETLPFTRSGAKGPCLRYLVVAIPKSSRSTSQKWVSKNSWLVSRRLRRNKQKPGSVASLVSLLNKQPPFRILSYAGRDYETGSFGTSPYFD